MTETSRAIRWLFEDRRTGRLVIAQWPNLTMWVVLAALGLSFVIPAGRAANATQVVLYVALALWALDELMRGVNPWRRLLGLGTLAVMIVWFVVLKR